MGLVHIYCGDGKGKTSAAVGLSVRAAGRGMRTVMARFLKTDDSGEVAALKQIPQILVLPCEETFGFVFSMDEETRRRAAVYYEALFRKAVEMAADCDLLILDEIMAAVRYEMVPLSLVTGFLDARPDGLEVVMTGRDPAKELLDRADYVSEIRKVKHPFDHGISARKGIEY